MSKYSDALELAEQFPAIFGPASSIKPQKSLRSGFARFLRTNSRNALFLTIQPNTARLGGEAAVRRTQSECSAHDADATWRLLGRVLYRLDALHTGCPSPKFLPPMLRFQGIAVLEKRWTNPHVHIMLSFKHRWKQVFGYLFLLEAFDNVPAAKWPYATQQDVLREADAWRTIRRFGSSSWHGCYDPKSSCLTKLSKAGTAKVLPVYTDADLKRVAGYMTKELGGITPESLASRHYERADGEYFDVRELREFHSPIGEINPARCFTYDENNPRSKILNLDKPFQWRCLDGTKLKARD